MIRILILSVLFNSTLASQSIEKYYQLINKAELKIINDSIPSAIEDYKIAFNSFEKPFSKDIHNALICSIKNGDNNLASELVKRLISLGCDLEFFRTNNNLDDYIKTKYWFEVVSLYPSLRKQYYSKINLDLRSKIESFLCRDQFWRHQDPNYTVLKDSTFLEDENLMEELHKIFESGYPDEYDVGLFFRNNKSIDHFNTIPVILLHNYTSYEKYKIGIDLTDKLLEYVHSGELNNGLFAYLHDRSGDFMLNFGYASTSIFKVRGKFYKDQSSIEVLKKRNLNRKTIWMDQLEDFYRKFIFQQNNSEFQFFTFPSASQIDLPDELVKKVFKELKLTDNNNR